MFCALPTQNTNAIGRTRMGWGYAVKLDTPQMFTIFAISTVLTSYWYYPSPSEKKKRSFAVEMTSTPQSKITKFDIERKGWKYVGYRGFSKFLTTDDDFLLFRRFDTFHARIILSLQDEMNMLTSELEELDMINSSKPEPDRHNGTFRNESVHRRSQILVQGKDLLLAYDTLLLRYSQLRKLPRATRTNIDSIENWLYNNGDPIHGAESLYLKNDRDLVSLIPKTKSSLRLFLDRYQGFRLSSLWTSHPNEDDHDDRMDNTGVYYASDQMIEQVMSLIILFTGMVMLIAPLWILNSTQASTVRLGVITTFIVLFLGLLSFTTNARPFESLAAAAAYSAVLMVFMQTSSNNT